jgi:hypothetical protein
VGELFGLIISILMNEKYCDIESGKYSKIIYNFLNVFL